MKISSIRPGVAAAFAALSFSAGAQSVPAYNVTDMWWIPTQSGWAISMQQSSTTNQVYALWHTYDPREPDASTLNPNDYKPIWIAMTGGTWTTPTTFVGDAFVTNATAYWMPYVPSSFTVTRVGRFTFNFTSANTANFSYEIAPPPGIASTDPAYGLPTLSGTKSVQRFQF